MSQQMGISELILHFFSLTYLLRTHTSRFFKWKGKRKEMKERRDKGKRTPETSLTSKDKEEKHCRKAYWTWLPSNTYLHTFIKQVLQISAESQNFKEVSQWVVLVNHGRLHLSDSIFRNKLRKGVVYILDLMKFWLTKRNNNFQSSHLVIPLNLHAQLF